MAGMEANVLDFEGRLDLEPGDARALDWVVASIPPLPLEGLQNPDVEKCNYTLRFRSCGLSRGHVQAHNVLLSFSR